MHPEGRRKCLHCEKFFLPDPRNRRGQRYCRKRACRKASKAESQRRWLKQAQNRDYFTGPENAARVRACWPTGEARKTARVSYKITGRGIPVVGLIAISGTVYKRTPIRPTRLIPEIRAA